ncbi:MAG TPA: hypothetical protein VGL89_03600 [Candidatus Koribacter sp.]|jgi:hypothetical protein
MKNRSLFHSLLIAVCVIGISGTALAGPPLICHEFNIGNARTLPSVTLNYQKGDNGYDLANLTRDTLAILDANPSVLVRMETLRRATIYARQDPLGAKQLLVQVYARANQADRAGHPDALAWFDAGFLAEAYKIWIGRDQPNPASNFDGYAWVKKAIQIRGGDPEMEFAAALMTMHGPETEHRAHVQKAEEGAKHDALLAQNLASTFHNQSMAQVLHTTSDAF